MSERETYTYSNNLHSVECPHCHEKFDFTDSYYELDSPESVWDRECPYCEEDMDLSFHVSTSVTARPSAEREAKR